MKKLITILGIVLIIILSSANQNKTQAQVTEIYNELMDGAQSAILDIMMMMDEKRNMLMEYAEELKENYEWLETIETVEKIDHLLDLTVCSEETFYLYAALRSDASCVSALEYEQVLFDYDASLDWLYLALSSLSMESGERISTLDDAIDYVERMQNEMKRISMEMDSFYRSNLIEDQIKKQSGDGWTINRY
jgi:hypothetical protein